MKIKARVKTNEHNNIAYYRNFQLEDYIPQVGELFHDDYKVLDLKEVNLDCEERNEELYNYKFYKIHVLDENDDEDFYIYSCIWEVL